MGGSANSNANSKSLKTAQETVQAVTCRVLEHTIYAADSFATGTAGLLE